MNNSFQLGVSQPFPCNYLPDKEERLLIAVDQRLQSSHHYSWLMNQGFRRSGDQIYRPYCEQCSACQSLRVIVDDFTPSKSQKRNQQKNKQLTVNIARELKEDYYQLYETYINEVHSDGAMYPANYEQYSNFLRCKLTEQVFIELWDEDLLVSVAVTDVLNNALSAVYTFYHPDYKNRGLGVYSILNQINVAKQFEKPYLYLGYQIDDCRKMNYKNRYFPHQILKENRWQTINK